MSENTRIKISDIKKNTDKSLLKKSLVKFGEILKLEMHTNCAYATFEKPENAKKAIKKLDRSKFEGSTIKARLSSSDHNHRKNHNSHHRRKSHRRQRERSKERNAEKHRYKKQKSENYKNDSKSNGNVKKVQKSALWDQTPTDVQRRANLSTLDALVVKMPDGTFANAPTLLGSDTLPTGIQNKVSPGTLNASNDVLNARKQSKRLVFANLPKGTLSDELKDFLNARLKSIKKVDDAVVSVFINKMENSAYVEFKDKDNTSFALSFNGINFKGRNLTVGRLKKVAAAGISTPMAPPDSTGAVSRYVPDGPGKIFCAGVPENLGEAEVKELVCTYGPVSSFFLPQEPDGTSKGFCFFVYEDLSVTQEAIRGLNGIQIGESTLTVKLHSSPDKEDPAESLRKAQEVLIKTAAMKKDPPSKVICLLNMVTMEQLKDEQEYKEIFEDVKSEAENFGRVREVVINRPGENKEGVGKVFVKFKSVSGARTALNCLEGRSFDKRTVYVKFFNEKDFDEGKLDVRKPLKKIGMY